MTLTYWILSSLLWLSIGFAAGLLYAARHDPQRRALFIEDAIRARRTRFKDVLIAVRPAYRVIIREEGGELRLCTLDEKLGAAPAVMGDLACNQLAIAFRPPRSVPPPPPTPRVIVRPAPPPPLPEFELADDAPRGGS